MTLARARSLVLLAVLSWHTMPYAQNAAVNTGTPSSNDINLLTHSALQQGVLNCVGRINQVGNFLGFGAQAGAVFMAPGDRPDQRLLSFSMEVPSAGSAAYIAATFAPNQANGCGAVYEALVYWQQSCESLVSKEYSNLKRIGQLKTAITVLDGGAAIKLFLMPAGDGCLSIKKEVVQ